jgi:hypothetical protein
MVGELLFDEESHGAKMSRLDKYLVVTGGVARGWAKRLQGCGDVVSLDPGKNAVRTSLQVRATWGGCMGYCMHIQYSESLAAAQPEKGAPSDSPFRHK